MEFYVRPATERDSKTIRHISEITWPVAYGKILSVAQLRYMLDWLYSEEKLAQDARNGHQFRLVETDAGTPAGFCGFEKRETAVHLHKLYVLPQFQGFGLGRMLLEEAIRYADDRRLAVTLNVNRHNPARDFYAKLGFRIVETVDISIGEGYLMEDFIMERPFSG